MTRDKSYGAEDAFLLRLILKCKLTEHKQSATIEVLVNSCLLRGYMILL